MYVIGFNYPKIFCIIKRRKNHGKLCIKMSKISIGNKGEEKVKKVLDSIKEYHLVFNNISFKNSRSEMTHQVDHILVISNGVFVIETKNYSGEICVQNNGKNWYKKIGKNVEKISSPVYQNKSHAVTVYKAINGYVKVIPVVVFVQNNAPYIEDENVINLDDLKLFISTYASDTSLDNSQIDEIGKRLKDSSIKISRKDHVWNIKYYKVFQEEKQAEMSYAIENNKCPRCGHKIIERNNIF